MIELANSIKAQNAGGDKDPDAPKTKDELKLMQILEKERSRVSKAANRREEWINMVATDPDFIQGK